MSFAWSAGGGFRWSLAEFDLELGAEYRSGTHHDFLLPSDVRVANGAVVAQRAAHQSDQIIIRLVGFDRVVPRFAHRPRPSPGPADALARRGP